jgi:hypothetical protein
MPSRPCGGVHLRPYRGLEVHDDRTDGVFLTLAVDPPCLAVVQAPGDERAEHRSGPPVAGGI